MKFHRDCLFLLEAVYKRYRWGVEFRDIFLTFFRPKSITFVSCYLGVCFFVIYIFIIMDKRKLQSQLSWKDKAKNRREENKNLKKRIAESRQSRDSWCEKYKLAEAARLALETELLSLKKKKQL